ncbi:unnamed protein product [Lupinus luteus]|uniref:Uncharacterized protein n=1 Tax=Lupinus luteus TaxID=3873 RepID=A0AAV1WEW2_LUPLU
MAQHQPSALPAVVTSRWGMNGLKQWEVLKGREYTFSDMGNLEHCAKFLNQSLMTFGFPSSLDLFANDHVN